MYTFIMFDTMKTWRSIRSYLDKQIGEDLIKSLITTGSDILNNTKEQFGLFTVIQDKETISELNTSTKSAMKKESTVEIIKRLGKTSDFDIFYGAPTVIMVSVKDKSKLIGDACNDAVQKIVSTAKSLGLTASWNSFVKYCFSEDTSSGVRNDLNIPENYTPCYAISIGYPHNGL